MRQHVAIPVKCQGSSRLTRSLGRALRSLATALTRCSLLGSLILRRVLQHGHEVTTKHEKFQNRFFAIVDGPQPHIAWFKDQKDYKAKKAPQGTLALRQGTATIQKGVDSSLLPVGPLWAACLLRVCVEAGFAVVWPSLTPSCSAGADVVYRQYAGAEPEAQDAGGPGRE